jgi:hypothetical protein
MATETDYSTIQLGCYVDGAWGWRGIAHLVIDQFPELATTRERRIMSAYSRGWAIASIPEIAVDIADAVEARLRQQLPEGIWCGWEDGEFFVYDPSAWDGLL